MIPQILHIKFCLQVLGNTTVYVEKMLYIVFCGSRRSCVGFYFKGKKAWSRRQVLKIKVDLSVIRLQALNYISLYWHNA